MITVAQTTSVGLIQAFLSHPDIYPDSSDDGTPAPADLAPSVGDGLYWLIAYLSKSARGKSVGVFFFHRSTSTTFEFHVGILKPYRGAIGYQAGRLALEWMAQHTGVRKVICWVETDAPHVYAYVKALGFDREGKSTGSIQHQGVLKDRYLMGQILCQ